MSKTFDPDLAIKLSRIVHNECNDVPHDIGMKLAAEAHEHTLKHDRQKRKIIPTEPRYDEVFWEGMDWLNKLE